MTPVGVSKTFPMDQVRHGQMAVAGVWFEPR